MALKNANPTDTAILNTPAFEAEEDDTQGSAPFDTTVQVTKVADTVLAATAEPAVAAKVEAVTVVATPAPASPIGSALAPQGNTAISTNTGFNKLTLAKQAQNAIPTETLEGMQLGTFPRITINTGGFVQDKEKKLGETITFELNSWSYVWMVTTGAQNNPEANKLLRTSYDGVNLKDNGGRIDAYIAQLKTDGYKDAASKKYIEVYASLVSAEKGGVIPVEDQPFVQISLSPQTVGKWEAFLLESTIKIARGVQQDGMLITGTGQSKTLAGNTFGFATFALAKK